MLVVDKKYSITSFAAVETFQYLLGKKASMVDICDWINELIERHLTSRIDENGLANASRKFLIVWKSISSKIVRLLCQNSDGQSEAKSTILKVANLRV